MLSGAPIGKVTVITVFKNPGACVAQDEPIYRLQANEPFELDFAPAAAGFDPDYRIENEPIQ